MKSFVFVCVVALLAIVANSKTLPALPKACRRSDPNISTCYQNALNKLMPYVATGMPQYNMLPLDPFEEPVIHIKEQIHELLAIDLVSKDVKVVGMSQGIWDNVKVDSKKLTFEADLTCPSLHLTGNFKITAKLMNAPLSLQGSTVADFADVKLHLAVKFKTVKKQGRDYFIVDYFKPSLNIGHNHGEISAKNPQDQPIADFIAKLFNDNDATLFEIISTFRTKIVERILRLRLAQALSKVPVQTFLVD